MKTLYLLPIAALGAALASACVKDDPKCSIDLRKPEIEGAMHLVPCTPVTYRNMPPASGNHYRAWAAYDTYAQPIPWGFLVHSMEHGAVVLTYRCPEGCPDEIAAARALIDELPVDPLCSPPVKRRIILAPAPDLETRWAASAWGSTLTSNCFDKQALATFIRDNYARGPEDICVNGVDRSAIAWCPSPMPTDASDGATPDQADADAGSNQPSEPGRHEDDGARPQL